ncbi:MAG: DUF3696 domain-containing protein [Anaerolineales bacterium]|nr:DUF3696 domain-containing protein [Anaerolineales bacterium]
MQPIFRWKNFRCFADTGWVEIKPLTIVLGPNNSGKSSLIAPLLLLKQTLESSDVTTALMTKGPLIDVGLFKDFVHNHDPNKQLSLDIRFVHSNSKKKGEVGESPPGEFISLFEKAEGVVPNDIQLSRYFVKDIFGRAMLSRTKQKDYYSLNFRPKGTLTKEIKAEILKDTPKHFYFVDAIQRILRKHSKSKKSNQKGITFTSGEFIYFAAASAMAELIEDFFQRISYIGPLREPFKRFYEFSGEAPQNIGAKGQNAPEIIARGGTTSQKRWLDFWTEKFDFGGKLSPRNGPDNNTFHLELKGNKNIPIGNLFDTGSGLSQVLPLIVEGTRSPKGSLIICEQPEIHLNPRLQVLLSDLFVEIANQDKNVILETHSEHLLLRLRRLIAEGKIKKDQVSILFVEKRSSGSQVRNIPINDAGHINEQDWPMGFFGESLKEAFGLAISQSRAGNKRKNAKRTSN